MASNLRITLVVNILLVIFGAWPVPAFAQSPTLQLTAPSQGQVLQVGQTTTITWSSVNLTSDLRLDLYKGSERVLNIATVPVAQARYDWSIPRPIGDGSDYQILADCGGLVSWGQPFTIQGGGPAPHLLSLNDGEILEAGVTYTIRWTEPASIDPCSGLTTFIRLYKGQQHIDIIGWPAQEGGSLDWTLCPTLEPGDDYVLKLEIWACDVVFTDWSDRPFSVHSNLQPSLVLVSPNGGETLTAGQPLTVRWSAVDLGDQPITVAFGRRDSALATIGTAPASAGELTVNLCTQVEDAWDYTIGVSAIGCQPQLSDSNDAPFHVVNPSPPSPLKIVRPVGGEIFDAGAHCLVEWTGPQHDFLGMTTGANLTLRKAGEDYDPLLTALLTPNLILTDLCAYEEGDDYSIHLMVHDCGGDHEAETPPFTITHVKHPSLTLLSPRGGGTLRAGEPLTIRWTGTQLADAVDADLFKNGHYHQRLGTAPSIAGQLIANLCSGTPDGSDYTIIIYSSEGCNVTSDSSDQPITITGGWPAPDLTITSPAAGAVWITGTRQPIVWTGSSIHGSVSAELWHGLDNLGVLPFPEPTDAKFEWDVCAWEPGDNYTILLKVYDCGSWYAFRSQPFTIQATQDPPPTLTLTSPNGGELIPAGSHQVVTWTSTNPRGQVDIRLMRSETDWDDLGQAPMAEGRFEWDVCGFGQPDVDYTIRVSQSQCTWYLEDSSDAPFTIAGLTPWPRLTVVSPSVGEVVQAGSSTAITWTAENPSGNVTISLCNHGFPWLPTPLGEAPMSAGSFTWEVCPWLPAGSEYCIYLTVSQPGSCSVAAFGFSFAITGSGLAAADLDLDCDVDTEDQRRLLACFTGPGVTYNLEDLPSGCMRNSEGDAYVPADLDRDGDVDQTDFGLLQQSFRPPLAS